MFCSNCRKELNKNAQFCSNCGCKVAGNNNTHVTNDTSIATNDIF